MVSRANPGLPCPEEILTSQSSPLPPPATADIIDSLIAGSDLLSQQTGKPLRSRTIQEAKESIPEALKTSALVRLGPDFRQKIDALGPPLPSPNLLAECDKGEAKRRLTRFLLEKRQLGQQPLLAAILFCLQEIRTNRTVSEDSKLALFYVLKNLLNMLSGIYFAQKKARNSGKPIDDQSIMGCSGYRACLEPIAIDDFWIKNTNCLESAKNELPQLMDVYYLCHSLYLQSPSELCRAFNHETRVPLHLRGKFFGALLSELLKITPEIPALTCTYAEFLSKRPVNGPDWLDEALGRQHSEWFSGVSALAKSLSSDNTFSDPSERSNLWKSYLSIFQRMENSEYLSPLQLAIQQSVRRQADSFIAHKEASPLAKFPNVEEAILSPIMFQVVKSLDLATEAILTGLLDVFFQNSQGPNWLDFGSQMTNYLEIIRFIQSQCESPSLRGLMRQLNRLSNEPWVPFCDAFVGQLHQIATRGGDNDLILNRIGQILKQPATESSTEPLSWFLRTLYDELNENRREVLSLLHSFEDLSAKLQKGEIEASLLLSHIMESGEWLIGLKTLYSTMVIQLISEINNVIDAALKPIHSQLSDRAAEWLTVIPRTNPGTTKNRPKQVKPKKQPKRASPPSSSQKIAKQKEAAAATRHDEAMAAPADAEELPPLTRALSDGATAVELLSGLEPLCDSPPNRVSRCLELFERVGSGDFEAQRYLDSAKVFLNMSHELTNRSPITEIDMMRRTLEFVLRALLSSYSSPYRDQTTHDLEYFTCRLLEASIPGNMTETLNRALPFLRFIAQSNEAIHYPLTSDLRNPRFRDLIGFSLQGDTEATVALKQVANTGLNLIQHLLEAAASPKKTTAKFAVPKFDFRKAVLDEVDEEMAPAASATLPLEASAITVSHIQSAEIALLVIQQLQQWYNCISRMAVVGEDSNGHRSDQRNKWLRQGKLYLDELKEVVHQSEEMLGVHCVVRGLSLSRRALKALLQAALYHNEILAFNPHENNPRILANLLGKRISLPRAIGSIHGLTTSPAPNPIRGEEEDVLGIGLDICACSTMALMMAASPGQDGYQIGGKTRTPETHTNDLSNLWQKASRGTIFPVLTALMEACKKGF